jgi:hypothetical protein
MAAWWVGEDMVDGVDSSWYLKYDLFQGSV